LREPVAFLTVGDDHVRVVQETVDGRVVAIVWGISLSNPEGWMLELIAIERLS